MREMLNKVTFLTNICFMALNNAAFIIQWVILFHLKKDIGGYTMKEVMLLWGLAASTFGLARILFNRAFSLPELIINGKLDSYLVMPKNVLLSVITSSTNTSAIGDLLYGLTNSVISFATYPDGIFRGKVRFLLYNIIPVGMSVYIPVHVMTHFDMRSLLTVTGYTILISAAAVFVFYRGLRRYSSSNLMAARM